MKVYRYLIICIIATSCHTEKITFSPVGGALTFNDPIPLNRNFKEKSDIVFYSSELTNQISTFPKFQNSAVNDEVQNLKSHIKDYVFSLQEYKIEEKAKALSNVEKSYKKIQKLRGYLNADDNNIINRYLVRIKGTISKLEALLEKEQKNTELLTQ